MILHIIPNHRFIHAFTERFELALPRENRWFAIRDGNQPAKEDSPIINNIEGDDFWVEFKKQLTCKADLICLHSLNGYNVRLGLRLVDEGYKVLPFLWAGEYPELLSLNPLHPYMRETKKYILGRQSVSRALYHRILDASDGRMAIFRAMVSGRESTRRLQITLLNQVKHFVTPVSEEGKIIIKKNRLSSRVLSVPYGWIQDEILNQEISSDCNEIQVGHSAWPMNNHLDVFALLKRHCPMESKICCPLAYGDSVYLDFVKKQGHMNFGANFISPKDFIPQLDYFRSLGNVATYIAAQRVQFGLGNVRNMVAMGKRVVLPKENPIFSYLKKMGVNVSVFGHSINLSEPLSAESAHTNKEIAMKYWSREPRLREIQENIKTAIQA